MSAFDVRTATVLSFGLVVRSEFADLVMMSSRAFRALAVAACQGFLASAVGDGQTDYVINVKPPQEEDGDVVLALDGVMRSAESAASAANAEFAEGKRRMLEAERAELRRLVRASR